MWLDGVYCAMISLSNLRAAHFLQSTHQPSVAKNLSIILDKDLIKTRSLEGKGLVSHYTYPKLLNSLLYC